MPGAAPHDGAARDMHGGEPSWHRRDRRQRTADRTLVRVANAANRVASHHSSGTASSSRYWVCPTCSSWWWDSTRSCQKCEATKSHEELQAPERTKLGDWMVVAKNASGKLVVRPFSPPKEDEAMADDTAPTLEHDRHALKQKLDALDKQIAQREWDSKHAAQQPWQRIRDLSARLAAKEEKLQRWTERRDRTQNALEKIQDQLRQENDTLVELQLDRDEVLAQKLSAEQQLQPHEGDGLPPTPAGAGTQPPLEQAFANLPPALRENTEVQQALLLLWGGGAKEAQGANGQEKAPSTEPPRGVQMWQLSSPRGNLKRNPLVRGPAALAEPAGTGFATPAAEGGAGPTRRGSTTRARSSSPYVPAVATRGQGATPNQALADRAKRALHAELDAELEATLRDDMVDECL